MNRNRKSPEENTTKKKKRISDFISLESRFSLYSAAGRDDTPANSSQPPAAELPGPWLLLPGLE